MLAGAGLAAVLVALQAGRGDHSAAVACALLATALVLGEVTSSHRDIATAAARHAHDLDRASLARELHDVLAHQLSAIAVQAGAARLASSADPLAAARAIGTIEREARAGLTELNKLVRGMREAGAAGPACRSWLTFPCSSGGPQNRACAPSCRWPASPAASAPRLSWPATGWCRKA